VSGRVAAKLASEFARHDSRPIIALGCAGHPRLRALHLTEFCRAAWLSGRRTGHGRVRIRGRLAVAIGRQQLKSLFPSASAALLYL
jgi:hypothetical protein